MNTPNLTHQKNEVNPYETWTQDQLEAELDRRTAEITGQELATVLRACSAQCGVVPRQKIITALIEDDLIITNNALLDELVVADGGAE